MSSIRTIALAKAIGGGGGSSIEVEELSVSQNGTTTAPEGKAYNPVVVNVPNSYAAGDEGKVVSNGALVAQTSRTVTANNTYDTTLNNEMVVNVQPPLQQKTVNANGDVTPDEGYYGLSKVVVDVPQGGGGGSVAAKSVNFRDYDGTIVVSYTAEEFAALSALPANPDRTSEGLTAQGWNWSLSDAKTYVAAYGRLEIGQMYVTTDGKTHVHIHLEQGRTSPMLGICPNGTVDVDWGDGTAHDTLTGSSTSTVQWTPTHNYAAPGDYVIKLTVTGSMGFYGSSGSNEYCGLLRYSSSADTRNSAYRNAIQKVEIGTGVTSIVDNAFNRCYSLASITIPSSVTSIGNNAFNNCYSLASITIPSSVTSIGNNAFQHCYSLPSITIPSSVTSIGDYVFYYCYSLSSITIPSSVTSIGNNAFQGCSSLASITIPSSVTSIGNNAFQGCSSLASITIPSSVTSIVDNAFNNCSSLAELHFKRETPPNVSNSNAFSYVPRDCKIYVPTGKLSAYTGASNYPSSSTYTYIEE